MHFEAAVQPALRLIGLFQQLPASIVDQVPKQELELIRQSADSTYQLFDSILQFNLEAGEPRAQHDNAVQKLSDNYQPLFSRLFPLISYSIARTVDFNHLEEQGRAAVQSIKDQTKALMGEIEHQQTQAAEILDEVRSAAAEQGVSQQAKYFKEEADLHATEAEKWRDRTAAMAIAVGFYGLLMLFMHKWAWLAPSDLYETIQFTVGKVVVFFVLTYVLVLCAKNFLSNRHNQIVNRHRQNALMTYKALVDAGASSEARDIVLNHAASSIYRLHETGYTQAVGGAGTSSASVIEMLPRTSLPINANSGNT
jgi:uncharacterized membrane protein (DUF485 family)